MTKRLLFGLLAAALLVAAFPIAALAQSDEPPAPREGVELTDEGRSERLRLAKEHVIDQIERRLTALDRLSARVDSAKYITDGHAATLQTEYATAARTLTEGIDLVAATASMEELREVAPPIFENTLVFALLGPKTHAVIGSDAVSAVTTRYEEFGAKLQDALDRLAETGVDVTVPQSDLDAAARLVADAAASGGPVADAVIGLQPGDDIAGPLAEAKAALEGTRAQLGEAKDLAKGVAEFIRSHVPDDEG